MNLNLNDWGLTRRIMHDKRCTRRMTESALPARLELHARAQAPLEGGFGETIAGHRGFTGTIFMVLARFCVFFRSFFRDAFGSVLGAFLGPKRAENQ